MLLFTLAICATTISFLISGKALNVQKARVHDYYIAGDDAAFARRNCWDSRTAALNYSSAGAFLLLRASHALRYIPSSEREG